MTISITCYGCGQRFDVPDDHERRKIRCAECGVYCEVPELKKSAATRPLKAPAPGPVEKQKARAPTPRSDADDIYAHGYREDISAKKTSETSKSADPLPKAPPQPPRAPAPVTSDKDDGAAYRFADPDLKKCPDCGKQLALDARLCIRCGFDLENGKRPVRVYEEVERSWESGWPLEKRLQVYFAAVALVLTVALLGGWLLGRWGLFVTPWIIFSLLSMFVLGTFDRLHLARDTRGRVRLTQTWRVCFFPRPPVAINVREYEGVATGPGAQGGFMDWIVLLMLLQLAVLPGVFWFFFGMHQESFYVALTKDHGFPERIIHRGWNEPRIREIADTLHDVAELPHAR